MGFDEAAIAGLRAMIGRPNGFAGVWPQNAAAVTAFLAAASQWRTNTAQWGERLVARFTGLDYAGAAVAWTARGIEMDSETFDGLTVMEMEARDALNGEMAGEAS